MPAPASDAIASDIGHGALGVRYGLRPFRDLLSETVGQRHLWVELRPRQVVSGWTSDGGGLYHKTASLAGVYTLDGVTLDIVGCQTLTETLSRVESAALCTAGHFYWNGGFLYIHLTADANPGSTTVIIELGVHLGSHGVSQPILLPDRLANGTFEAWTGSNPDGWTIVTGAGITLDKTTSDPLQGSYAARWTFTASTSSASLGQQSTTLAAGQTYRLSGAYRVTCAAANISLRLYVDDGAGTAFVCPDGRATDATSAAFDSAIGDGEWKRFAFDFVCPSWATVRVRLYAIASGAATGTVDCDDVKLQCVARYAYHEPLLSVDSLPTIEAARSDSFWGEMSSALGSLSIANGGGQWDALIAAHDWIGAACIVRVGGRFQLGANETLIEDCPVIATGKGDRVIVKDGRITFDVTDDRKLLQTFLPLRTYNNNGGVDAYTEPDRGRSRAMLWGRKTGIRPVQYDIAYYSGGPVPLGVYEIADCSDWSSGIDDLLFIDTYQDDQAALARSTDRRTHGDTTTWVGFSLALSTGRFTMQRDLRPIVITSEENKVHFDVGGARFVATAPVGTYVLWAYPSLPDLLTRLQDNMRAEASVADINVTFVDSTQKVQISKDAGTLNLRCKTGDGTGDGSPQNGIWALLGFDVSADKTGALTYNADNVFTSQAFNQTIRVDAIGYVDDASGTYTGTAGVAIEKACDIAHHILRAFLKVPASAIDVASFVAARTGADECSLYIGSPRTVADVFAELEVSGNFDLVLSGGIWSCVPRDTSVPAGTPELVDADFLSFEAYYDPEDLFGTVTLTYNESPDGGEAVVPRRDPWGGTAGRTKKGETTDATIALRFGRSEQKTFKTCLRDEADATNPLAGSRLEAIAAQAQTKRRRFRFSTKGKALMVPICGKIQLTRSQGLDTTGALSQVLVRVLRKRDGWARWISDVEAIEVI